MPQIPVDQKFHTLNANTPTKERGSAQADGLREIYTMQDIIDSVGGGGSFRAIPYSSIGSFTQLCYISGVDEATGLPIVRAAAATTPSTQGFRIAGLVPPDAVRYEPSDIIVSGEVNNVGFITPTGGGAEVGDVIYAGTSYYLTWGGGPFYDENFAVGRILTTPTFVQSFSGYDVWSATVLVTLPENTAYYHDKVAFNDSIRPTYSGFPSTVVGEYNIVKSGSTGILISRWDPAGGDTVDQILGVTAQGYTPGYSVDPISVCIGGIMRIPRDTFVGPTPVVGDAVYSDSTTPYLLTTSSTSGFRIGFIVKAFFDATDNINVLLVKVEVARSGGGGGGGSTTGEDLSLDVRSSAYAGTGDHEGTVLSIGSTASLTVGTVYYWNGTDWADANASAEATAKGLTGVATDTGVAPDVLVSGIIQLASVPGAVGDPLYLDTTNGLLTATAPSANGNIVRVMGYKLDTNRVYFNPSADFFEIA
jgi:hypothetical protein